MATIKDIAKLAGVSISTASRALNDNPRISEATRTKVKQIAAELGVSEQAISKRRLASFFEEEAEALPLAIALIEALDPVPTGAAS